MTTPSVFVVPLVGPDGVGKSTLLHGLASRANAAPRQVQIGPHVSQLIDVRGPRGILQLVDFPSHEAEHALLRGSPFAGAVLVVKALDGVVPGTKASLETARGAGIPKLFVAITHCDLLDDVEMLELIEMETRELLNKFEYDGDKATVVAIPARAPRQREPVGVGQLFDAIAREFA